MKLILIWMAFASPAKKHAPAPAKPVAAPVRTEPPKVLKAAPAASKDDFDFDFLDKPKAKSAAELAKVEETERLAKKRRTMLLIHQALGFTLMGVATANFALGVLNYYDKFGGGGFNNTWEIPHLISSMVVTGVFAANGILALFTPDPYDKPARWDSARVHRILMASATVGMVAQIVLGFVSAARYGHVDQRDLARVHFAIGTATYALTMAGGLTYLF